MGEPRAGEHSHGNGPIDADRAGKVPLVDAELTRLVIGAFYRVYNRLGFGFLESVYRESLRRELLATGVRSQPEARVDVWDLGEIIGTFRADLLVQERLVLELKATERLDPSTRRQLLNCLRSCDLELGLVLHFGPEPRFHRLIQTVNCGREQRKDP